MTKKIFFLILAWAFLLVFIHLSPFDVDRLPQRYPAGLTELQGHENLYELKPQPVEIDSKFQSDSKEIPVSVFENQPAEMTFSLDQLSREFEGATLKFKVNRFADGYALSKPILISQFKDLLVKSLWISINSEPVKNSTWADISIKIKKGSQVALVNQDLPLVISSSKGARKGDSISVFFGDIQ